MKKIYFIVSIVVLALVTSCEDFNKTNFPDLVGNGPTNVADYSYTLLDADYTSLSKEALKLAKTKSDSTNAKAIATNKFLQDIVPTPKTLIPLLLKIKYPYVDINSLAKITYTYAENRPAYMNQLSELNLLDASDYQIAWGSTNNPSSFTPSVSPIEKLPAILTAKYPNEANNSYKFIQYKNSSTEAVQKFTNVNYYTDNFETHTSATTSPYTSIGENGWLNADLTGLLKWQCRIYSGNKYAQVSSNKSTAINTSWLITKQIDLTDAINPTFSFDVNVGYWNASCLTVWLSENYDGTQASISTATWTEITSNFTIPTAPASGYGALAPAGSSDLTSFAGKKLYIAFKYSGDDTSTPKKTSTYQIDNIKVAEVKMNLFTADAKTEYAVYKRTNNLWFKSTEFDVLQNEDYAAMGVNFISAANSQGYLPQWLLIKYPYAQEGTIKNVINRSSDDIKRANVSSFTFTKGVWVLNTNIITKTEQYIYISSGWVFDPTIKLEIKQVSGGNNPYVMKFIEYLILHSTDAVNPTKWYQNTARMYVNEEHYYGFSGFYGQIIYSADRTTYGDAEIKALTTDVEKYVLFQKRIKEAMPLFTQLNYPNLTDNVSGVQQYVEIKIPIYYNSSKISSITAKMKCVKTGSTTEPAVYEVESLVESL